MLRRSKRHQNPPLIVAPFCGHTKERRASFGAGFPWANAANDRQVRARDSAISRVNFMTRPLSTPSGRQCDAESVGGISHIGVVTVAVGWPDIPRIIPPGTRPDAGRGALALDPCRTVRRSALVVLVPAILYPLIDAAAHIVQSKRIWLEAADLDRVLGGRGVGAILAIGHAGLKLIAPPVLCLRASARRIFPFSFGWESKCLSSGLREPRDILPGIAPAYIGDRRIVFSGRCEPACFCGSAFIPFPY